MNCACEQPFEFEACVLKNLQEFHVDGNPKAITQNSFAALSDYWKYVALMNCIIF